MTLYTAILYTHISCAVLTIISFVLRGFWMMTENSLLTHRLVRIAPHVIDTVLLISAITLAVILRQHPFVHHWLTAKVLALLAYIALGMIALRYGPTKNIRVIAFVGAVVTFFYIVSVARYRHPAGIFILLS